MSEKKLEEMAEEEIEEIIEEGIKKRLCDEDIDYQLLSKIAKAFFKISKDRDGQEVYNRG